jgi:hypothetical protein
MNIELITDNDTLPEVENNILAMFTTTVDLLNDKKDISADVKGANLAVMHNGIIELLAAMCAYSGERDHTLLLLEETFGAVVARITKIYSEKGQEFTVIDKSQLN